MFGLLRRTFNLMDADILLTLDNALCRCLLDYDGAVWYQRETEQQHQGCPTKSHQTNTTGV